MVIKKQKTTKVHIKLQKIKALFALGLSLYAFLDNRLRKTHYESLESKANDKS